MPLSKPKSDPIALILHLPVASYFWVNHEATAMCYVTPQGWSVLSLCPSRLQPPGNCASMPGVSSKRLSAPAALSDQNSSPPLSVYPQYSVSHHLTFYFTYLFMFSIFPHGTKPYVGRGSYLIAIFLEPRPLPT